MGITLIIGAIALVASSAMQAGNRAPDGLVNFVNSSSATVSVSVDGNPVCTIGPGNRCSTVLSGEASHEHPVSAVAGGRTWNDRIRISECHWNYNGTKTYTFRDDSVPFACAE